MPPPTPVRLSALRPVTSRTRARLENWQVFRLPGLLVLGHLERLGVTTPGAETAVFHLVIGLNMLTMSRYW